MSEQVPNYTAVEREAHRDQLRILLAAIGDNGLIIVWPDTPAEFAIRAGCNALGRVGELGSEIERLHHKIAHLHNVAEEADAAARAAENECRLAAKYIAMSPCDPDCRLDYDAIRQARIKKDTAE